MVLTHFEVNIIVEMWSKNPSQLAAE